MIFVSVGTQMPFDRMVRTVDYWASEHRYCDVYAQIGSTTWQPSHIRWTKFLSPGEFRRTLQAATVIVAHAGSGTILTAMEMGKPILVMPRRAHLRETRSDHQMDTCQKFRQMGAVEVAIDESELARKLDRLDTLASRVTIGPYASQQLTKAIRYFIVLDKPCPKTPKLQSDSRSATLISRKTGQIRKDNDITYSSSRAATNQAIHRNSDGIICYAGVDWWYHSQGHSDFQIMLRLAKKVPVLWINSIGMRLPAHRRNTELIYRRYLRKLRSMAKVIRREPPGIWVYSPLFLPRYTTNWLKLNGRILASQTTLLLGLLGIRKPSLWITLPTAAPAVQYGKWTTVVFNRCDKFSAFSEADEEVIKNMEQCLLELSDHVLYVSHELMQEEKGQVKRATYLGHGVDFNHFDSARTLMHQIPQVFQNLSRPIVGFYGTLHSLMIDLELMIKVARHIGKGTLLVIGMKDMDITPLLREKNVVYLGPVPYRDLPAYANQFDVGIMPWLQNSWTRNCNPVKLKEYLAVGFPVVTMRFPELRPFEHLVYPASTHGEFLASLDLALAERNTEARIRRRAAVADSSWDEVARKAGMILGVW